MNNHNSARKVFDQIRLHYIKSVLAGSKVMPEQAISIEEIYPADQVQEVLQTLRRIQEAQKLHMSKRRINRRITREIQKCTKPGFDEYERIKEKVMLICDCDPELFHLRKRKDGKYNLQIKSPIIAQQHKLVQKMVGVSGHDLLVMLDI